MEEYFTKTATGRQRTAWIVPTPFESVRSRGDGGDHGTERSRPKPGTTRRWHRRPHHRHPLTERFPPFFVSSDMAYAVQAADLCIYCVNGGARSRSQSSRSRGRARVTRTSAGSVRVVLEHQGVQGARAAPAEVRVPLPCRLPVLEAGAGCRGANPVVDGMRILDQSGAHPLYVTTGGNPSGGGISACSSFTGGV